MALSIAPALAAGNGNAGSVKIHEVGTSVDDPGNDPQVCTFTIVFFGFDAGASGAWEINGQPSAAGDPVLEGTFTANANGDSETQPITLAAGHYKLDWTPTGGGTKSKSFIVKDSCAPTGSGSGGPGSESTPGASPSQPAASEPAASQPAASQPAASQPAATDPGSDASPDPDPSQPAATDPGSDASPDPDPSQPAATDPGSDASPDPGTTDSGTTDQTNSGNPSGVTGQAPEGAVEATTGVGDGATLPDTAVHPQPIGITPLLTVLGLLLIVAAHPFIRRSAHADRA